MKILVLESKLHHKRARVFDKDIHFPDCMITYNGAFYYNRSFSYFSQFDLIVSTVFTSPTSDFIISKCKYYGIKTLLLSDGIIEWENMYNNSYLSSRKIKLYQPVIHDYFGVMGKLENRFFSLLNPLSTTLSFTPARADLGMKNKIISKGIYFLLTTANNAYVNEKEKHRVIDIYTSILAIISELKIPCKLRIFDKDILNALRKIDPNIKNEIEMSFSNCITDVKAVITGPSSIVFEAFDKELPVAQILYRNTPVFTPSGWYINSLTDIHATLISMQSPKPERLTFQKAVLDEHYSEQNLINRIVKFDNNELECNEQKFINSKYVINLEPYVRMLNDILKYFLPIKYRKKWVSFMKKFR